MDLKSISTQVSKDRIKELFSTPKGKGMAAGLLLVVLVLVVLVISTLAIPKAEKLAVEPVIPPPVAAQPQATTQTAEAETDTASSEGTYTVELGGDLSDYRDPFSPLIETTNTVGGSSITAVQGSTADVVVVPQSLSLQSVSEKDGVRYAQVVYQGQAYEAKAGDQIGESPFQVTDVGEASMSLLYGDDRLTLQLGDEIIK